MSYIEGYKYDIFISYPWMANIAIENNIKPWVENFVDHLCLELMQILDGNGKFKRYFDQRQPNNRDVQKDVEDGVLNSALFLAILNNRYLASEWCMIEYAMFIEKARQRKMADERLFLVEQRKVQIDALKNEKSKPLRLGGRKWDKKKLLIDIADRGCYQFFKTKFGRDNVEVLGLPKWDPGTENGREYSRKINELAAHIKNTMVAIRNEERP